MTQERAADVSLTGGGGGGADAEKEDIMGFWV